MTRYTNRTQDLYLDYVNNFLTVRACAEHYGISEHSMRRIINYWRSL